MYINHNNNGQVETVENLNEYKKELRKSGLSPKEINKDVKQLIRDYRQAGDYFVSNKPTRCYYQNR